MVSNTQRTLAYLKKKGYLCEIVEKWNPYVGPVVAKRDRYKNIYYAPTGIRKDAFGFADILAIHPQKRTISMIQSCGQSFAAHDSKIRENEFAPLLLRCVIPELLLIGWRKIKKKRGGKQKIWSPRIKKYTPGDFDEIKKSHPGDHQDDFFLF